MDTMATSFDNIDKQLSAYKAFVNSQYIINNRNTTASDYYVNFFFNEAQYGKVRWNWNAFCFGSLWFFYRKMYLYGVLGNILLAIADFIAIFTLIFVVDSLNISEVLSSVLMLLVFIANFVAFSLFYGYYGNSLYFRKFKRIMQDMPEEHHDTLVKLSHRGGVSLIVLLFLIVFNASGIILFMLL